MRSLLAAAALVVVAGCTTETLDATSSSETSDFRSPSNATPLTYAAPEVQGGSRYWNTVILHNEADFDGVVVFGSKLESGEPDRLLVFDRRGGGIAYLGGDDATEADELANVRDALDEASKNLTLMAGDFSNGDTRFADFVTEENACFLKMASIAVLAVGAVVAAPYVLSGASAGMTLARTTAARVAEQGLRAVAVSAGRAALANPRIRAYLAYRVVKTAAKAWLLLSDKGQELTEPIRRQVVAVAKADCSTR